MDTDITEFYPSPDTPADDIDTSSVPGVQITRDVNGRITHFGVPDLKYAKAVMAMQFAHAVRQLQLS